ncbi:MAG: two-component sensor histidine kinase, partial [Jiangellaceae bacterium]|nr:two-component sensor histidine kinase [Jiangellaceae bacterium]
MDVVATAALTAVIGALVGLAAGIAFRASEREQRALPQQSPSTVAQALDEVVSVLRGGAVLLDDQLE